MFLLPLLEAPVLTPLKTTSLEKKRLTGNNVTVPFEGSHQPLLLLVFVWRNHSPKLNFTFPSQVLGSSDKILYRNLTFQNVSARQGSSHCNRARLNFQAFALRDMNIAT